MVDIDPSVVRRSREAVRILSSMARVRAAYLFGSHAQGKPGLWSDIDVAAFVEGAEAWDIRRRTNAIMTVQRQVGRDVELHFFPAWRSENPPPGSFADYILRHGVSLEIENISS